MEYSLKDFTSLNPVTATIAENMVDLHLLDSVFGSFEDIACRIFTKAYDICRKIINESPIQIWRIPDFYRSASIGYDGKDADKIMGALTLSVVSILAEHFDDKLKFENQDFLKKLEDYIKKIYLTGETVKIGGTEIVTPLGGVSASISAYHVLRRGTEKCSWLSYEQFNPNFLRKHDELVSAKTIKAVSHMKNEKGKVVLDVPTLCNENIRPNKNNIIDQGGEIEKRSMDNSEIDYEKQIEELKVEIEKLRAENKMLKESNHEMKWIGCFDGFLDSNLNAEAIAEALRGITSPHLPKNERGYWWVFYTILTEINWIPKTNHKLALQWVNLHFDCGWDWSKNSQFKFSDINSKIKTTPSSKWNRDTTGNIIGDYYGELAKNMRNTFVESIKGKLIDKGTFIKQGCQRINDGRK